MFTTYTRKKVAHGRQMAGLAVVSGGWLVIRRRALEVKTSVSIYFKNYKKFASSGNLTLVCKCYVWVLKLYSSSSAKSNEAATVKNCLLQKGPCENAHNSAETFSH